MPNRLAALDGEWHEFESKALRKDNERKDKEARRAAHKAAAEKEKEKGKGEKRPSTGSDGEGEGREAKRIALSAPEKRDSDAV